LSYYSNRLHIFFVTFIVVLFGKFSNSEWAAQHGRRKESKEEEEEKKTDAG